MINPVTKFFAAVGGACLIAMASPAVADSYPSRPIKIVVPFAAGGGNDVLARLIAQQLSERLKQGVVIENRPGAGTQIGAEVVARAEPDGYTLLSTSMTTYVLNPFLYKKLSYDPLKDFAPISLTGNFDLMLVAHPSFPAGSLEQFVALAKAKPGDLSYASAGPGSPHQLAMELLMRRADLSMVHVAYRGAAPALQDVLAGHVPIMMLDVATAREPVKAGLLKAFGAASLTRFADFPDLPTIAEQGFPGYQASAWQGIVAPAKTPPEIVEKLGKEIGAALADAQVREKLRAAGIEPIASTPAEFTAFMTSETAKWADVIKAAKITLD
ncbi:MULTISPECIES: tripartite tricarboxylate transporter substrate binding protein [unclassified Beijerinckia]|uniref:Bug family tripartite tricarboxylate transporter substrate binding protein n=1 Tax=unclassified Beijerinckia TaxID=2638183 RepID=UPI0008980809|nr:MULTISPECIES: tripartite tricarboxylate transporter substrate binding protein [unclassified Beijerinckia]MDH7799457.1 tripartite-type tricarboxylate transporter receptor subunit TctC [Beijerinckia sp. GAS462]SED51126.1 Tripartite-type tricarboxylate transporter, receptor component TctC [Beijerinckia sp. 28-YEA-48]